ncbi:neutral cholesterol ester hydrolase 1-like [Ptychodera flava]|uniref:neutral cholesterol ester hydrolase 1-like n=1 Tax=Ptychodera flava TaxID=63121 RepID=UPI00396A5B4D
MVTVVLIVIAGAILAYLSYCPLPSGIAEPWRIRCTNVRHIIPDLVARGAVYLGFADPLSALRNYYSFDKWLVSKFCKDEPSVTFTDTKFDGVSVRIYQPLEKSENPIPAMVYIHGGGWVLGTKDDYHYVVRYIAARLGIVLVNIDYRLSPEYPFPVPMEDCTRATVWFLQNAAADFNVDPTRIALCGDSAGGNLAASTSARLTFDEKYQNMGLPKLKFQGLIYPAMQAVDFLTPSYQQNDITLLSKDLMTKFWSWYLSGDLRHAEAMKTNNHTCRRVRVIQQRLLKHSLVPETFRMEGYNFAPNEESNDSRVCNEIQDTLLNQDFAPLMRENLTGLPPTYIVTAGFDVLRDDGIMYAERLEQAGVPVTWLHYEEGFHGIFTGYNSYNIGNTCMRDFLRHCKENL